MTARFRIEIPEDRWIGELSRAYSSATFRLLSGVRVEDGSIQLGAVEASEPQAIAGDAADHPSITSLEVLEVSGDTLLGRYETAESGLYEFLEHSTLPPEYPIVVRDGWAEFTFTGTRSDLRDVRSWLDALGATYELVSLLGSHADGGILTDRQAEVLRAGYRAGYFEVPRRCTLAELAADLEVDKSTASEIIRRAHERLVGWYLTGFDVDSVE